MGTLLKLRAEGARITMITISGAGRGATPDDPISEPELLALREREARAVADAIGARYECLDAPDNFVQDTPELRVALTRLYQAAGADVVLAPAPTDYHADHVAASAIAMQAALMAHGRPVGPEPSLPRAPAVYHYDTLYGQDFEPGFYIDISDVIAEKKRLAEMHASQSSFMAAQGGRTLSDMIESLGRFRGGQSMAAYAEAFRISDRYPRVRAWQALPS